MTFRSSSKSGWSVALLSTLFLAGSADSAPRVTSSAPT